MKHSFLFTLILIYSIFAAENKHIGKVIKIADGDTFTLLSKGKTIRVRLNGIDCPESHQAFGNKAKQFTNKLIFQKEVTVISKDIDRYGRIIGDVFLNDGTNLNHELVKSGLAWWYQYYAPKDRILKRLEENARKDKIGLWSEKKPIPPWEFRLQKKMKIQTFKEKKKENFIETYQSNNEPSGTVQVYFNIKTKKYHKGNCLYLSSCKNCIPIPLDSAKARGGVPCKNCFK